MADHIKISQSSVAKLEPAKKPFIIWDTELTGFGIRVMPSGVKTYILKYRSPVTKKQCKPRIGRTSEMKAEAARRLASDWLNNLKLGIDPQVEKEKRIEADIKEIEAMTVAELCNKYMEEHAWPFKSPSSAEDDESMIRRLIKPAIGKKKAKDVVRADITAIFTKQSKTAPVAANRLIALLRKMFNFAIENKISGINDNPATHIKKNTEDARDVYLKPDEINNTIGEIMKVKNETLRDFMLLCCFTGCRPREAATAEWEQVDLVDGIWRKPSSRTKQNKVHRLPLNPAAISILEGREHQDRFVFPGAGRVGHIGAQAYKKTWEKIRVAIGRPEVRFYDACRHSFASLLQAKGADLQMIGKLLGHTQIVTTQRYVHLYDKDQREATNKAAEVINLDQHRKASA